MAEINVDVTLTRTTYLNSVGDQVDPFTAMVFPEVSGVFQQDNDPATLQTLFRNGLRNALSRLLITTTA